MNRRFVVSVEGNIGAGKSTLLECFSKDNSMSVFPEPVEKWRNHKGTNVFGLFMKEPHKWAFPFQSLVLQTLLEIHTTKISTPIRVMERSMFSVRHCFTEMLTQSQILHPVHKAILDEMHQFTKQTFQIGIDLIIYLRVNPEVAQQRIRLRGRTEESEINLSYLEDLHQVYEAWLNKEMCDDSGAIIRIVNANLPKSRIELEANKLKEEIKGFLTK